MNLFTILIGLITACGAIWAAWAAQKSAGTAQNAVRQAERGERRALIRDVLRAIESFCAEMTHIRELIEDMRRGIGDLKRLGGSPDTRVIAKAESNEGNLRPHYDQVVNLTALDFRDKAEDDLLEELTLVEGSCTQARQLL